MFATMNYEETRRILERCRALWRGESTEDTEAILVDIEKQLALAQKNDEQKAAAGRFNENAGKGEASGAAPMCRHPYGASYCVLRLGHDGDHVAADSSVVGAGLQRESDVIDDSITGLTMESEELKQPAAPASETPGELNE